MFKAKISGCTHTCSVYIIIGEREREGWREGGREGGEERGREKKTVLPVVEVLEEVESEEGGVVRGTGEEEDKELWRVFEAVNRVDNSTR